MSIFKTRHQNENTNEEVEITIYENGKFDIVEELLKSAMKKTISEDENLIYFKNEKENERNGS